MKSHTRPVLSPLKPYSHALQLFEYPPVDCREAEADDDAQRQYLKDAVNAIEQLDQSGNRIESNLNYRLLSK